MADQDIVKAKGKRGLSQAIATRATDPLFYQSLEHLPNPDRILRKLGKTQEVYDDIKSDAHVMGELRSVRSGLLGFEWRVAPGGDDSASMRAYELIEAYMQRPPARNWQWYDLIWSIAQAVFRGYAVHEVTWKRDGNYLMPLEVVDRPQNRFVFGIENELRLLTKNHRISGEPVQDKKFLITRHMASFTNPYGEAVFSSCFWPYIFKHSGFKYFAKFCEKYGLPWAVGKYPRGTSQDEINEYISNLQRMIEDAVSAIPDDGSVELLTVNSGGSGNLPQERMIMMCNSELSKALTSQTLATEIQGNGSRAASETHRERETSVNQSDRVIIEATINQLFAWITELNIAGAIAPTFEFYEEAEPRIEMVEFLQAARELVPLKKSEVYDRLQLTPPDEKDDVLPVVSGTQNPGGNALDNNAEFRRKICPGCGEEHTFKQDDQSSSDDDPVGDIIEQGIESSDDGFNDLINPIKDLLSEAEKDGLTMAEFKAKLEEIYPALDDSLLGNHMRDSLLIGYLRGMDEVSE